MKLYLLLPSIALFNCAFISVATAKPITLADLKKKPSNLPKYELLMQRLNAAKVSQSATIPVSIQPASEAKLLAQQPNDETNSPATDNPEIELEVEGQREPFSQISSPIYEITTEEIELQNPNSLAEVLRGLPGFAINDVGFGADIHTGFKVG